MSDDYPHEEPSTILWLDSGMVKSKELILKKSTYYIIIQKKEGKSKLKMTIVTEMMSITWQTNRNLMHIPERSGYPSHLKSDCDFRPFQIYFQKVQRRV